MKKLILTTVCALGVAGAAFAQGTVNWSSISAAGYTAQTNSTTYSPLFGGGSVVGGSVGNTGNTGLSGTYGLQGTYLWEILYLAGASTAAPTSLAALNTWSDAGIGATSTGSGVGRVAPVGPTTSVSVPWASGTTDNIVLVGWSENLGLTWAAALATLNSPTALGNVVGRAYLGFSTTGYIAPRIGDPGSVFIGGGASIDGTPIQNTLDQLYLIPVPEPGTLALAGLGGLALALFRRQRK